MFVILQLSSASITVKYLTSKNWYWYLRSYLRSSMTSGCRRCSLMRPTARGGIPNSSITVTCRKSRPHSAFCVTTIQSCIVNNKTFLSWDILVFGSYLTYLQHNVLELVSLVGIIWSGHNQKFSLLIKLVKQSTSRPDVCFYVHHCGKLTFRATIRENNRQLKLLVNVNILSRIF